MDETAYLKLTLDLMNGLGIPVRDTFSITANLDDYYSNGRYGGPALFKIEWSAGVATAMMSAKKSYEIDGRHSVAYDSYKISVPMRFQTTGRDDPVIHECVHFLQRNTKAEDDSYALPVDSSHVAYAQYVAQRVELEAHLVQIAYITQSCQSYMQSMLKADEIAEVHRLLAACGKGAPLGPTVQLILYCKQKQLI